MNTVVEAPLTKSDMAIILQVYRYNAAFPEGPFLVAPRKQKRAKTLADRGLLDLDENVKLLPNPAGWGAYRVNQAGIDAYNAAIAKATGETA